MRVDSVGSCVTAGIEEREPSVLRKRNLLDDSGRNETVILLQNFTQQERLMMWSV